VVDDGDAIAQLVGLVHVVRGQEHRQVALGLDTAEHLPHRGARDRVEAGGGLVEKEDARLVHQAARDLDAAAHAAGEVLDGLVGPRRQLDRGQELGDEPLAPLAWHAVQLGVDEQVLLGGELEVAGHRLRDDADGAAHGVGLVEHIGAGDARRAARRRQQGGEHADQRRLAGAVGAEHAEDFALADGEGDAVDGGEVAEALGEVVDLDGRGGHVSRPPAG
jgi:hypothetical protein